MPNNTLLTSDPQAIPQPLYSDSATAVAAIGQRAVTPDGRVFRYVLNGVVAMVPGKLYQAAAEVTANENLAIAAGAIGDTTITTTSTVTVTANQYAGGYAIITTSTGAGYQYLITGHPAATGAVLTITLGDPLLTALTASTSKLDLVASPFNGVVVTPVPLTGNAVGVAVYPVAASKYGWLQTGGVTALLADGTIAIGSMVGVSGATGGAVQATSSVSIPVVGTAATGIATTEYGGVRLTLDQ